MISIAVVDSIERIEVERGVALAAEVTGAPDLPVLMLSNSIGASLGMWDELVARLTNDFRIIRYDTRGHGRSDVAPGPYTIDRLGRDVLGILDTLGVRRAVFCGLSLGGLTGQWLGINASERLDGLILANTAASFPPPGLWLERAVAVRGSGMMPLVQPTLDRWFTRAFQQREPSRVAAIGKMVAATPAEGYAACCQVLAASDMLPLLSRITCPVQVIAGAHDPSATPARSEEIVARIAGATMATLDAAHISAIEAPDAFAAAVKQFMARVSRHEQRD
jgi:3-oxoadipate enol-lactonase